MSDRMSMSGLKRKTSAKDMAFAPKRLRTSGAQAGPDALAEIEKIAKRIADCAARYDAEQAKSRRKSPTEIIVKLHKMMEKSSTASSSDDDAKKEVKEWRSMKSIIAIPWWLKPSSTAAAAVPSTNDTTMSEPLPATPVKRQESSQNNKRDSSNSEFAVPVTPGQPASSSTAAVAIRGRQLARQGTDASVISAVSMMTDISAVSMASVRSTSPVQSSRSELMESIRAIQDLATTEAASHKMDIPQLFQGVQTITNSMETFRASMRDLDSVVKQADELKNAADDQEKEKKKGPTFKQMITMTCLVWANVLNLYEQMEHFESNLQDGKDYTDMTPAIAEIKKQKADITVTLAELREQLAKFKDKLDTGGLDPEVAKWVAAIFDKIEERQSMNAAQATDQPPTLPSDTLGALTALRDFLKAHPFAPREWGIEWKIKRALNSCLEGFVKLSQYDACLEVASECVRLMFTMGYFHSLTDAKHAVEVGVWKPLVKLMASRPVGNEECHSAVYVFLHLAEHTEYYEDYLGVHPEFWDNRVFLTLFPHVCFAMLVIPPKGFHSDQYEQLSQDNQSSFKFMTKWLLFWTMNTSKIRVFLDLTFLYKFLLIYLHQWTVWDDKWGGKIAYMTRGDPLQEMLRLLTTGIDQNLMVQFEDIDNEQDGQLDITDPDLFNAKRAVLAKQGVLILNAVMKALMLKIPTFQGPLNSDSAAGPRNWLYEPREDAQLEGDYFQQVLDRISETLPTGTGARDDLTSYVEEEDLQLLFKRMIDMPVHEQQYRLRVMGQVLPMWLGKYAALLENENIPAVLQEFRIVLNMCCQHRLEQDSDVMDLIDQIAQWPCLLDFHTKRAAIQNECEHAKMIQQHGEFDAIRLVVPRDDVLDGVCEAFHLEDELAKINAPLEVEFKSGYMNADGQEVVDEGEDQGGLRRQWLERCANHFVNSDLFYDPALDAPHLPEKDKDSPPLRNQKGRVQGRQIFQPVTEEVCKHVQDDWKTQYELFGCVIGLAIMYADTVPVHLGYNVWRIVFQDPDQQDPPPQDQLDKLLDELECADKMLHTKLKYILSGQYKDLGDSLADVLTDSNLPATFVVRGSHIPALTSEVELKPGGKNIEVTEENKSEYVLLLLTYIFERGIKEQCVCIRKGILRVINKELLFRISSMMTIKEFELMICGVDEIDVEDWKENSIYEGGYHGEELVIEWFWDVVKHMNLHEHGLLLAFSTGSSQVPSGGFRFLQPQMFTINKCNDTSRLPEAHTCINMIDLPPYETKEQLKERLMYAISQVGDAFGRV